MGRKRPSRSNNIHAAVSLAEAYAELLHLRAKVEVASSRRGAGPTPSVSTHRLGSAGSGKPNRRGQAANT